MAATSPEHRMPFTYGTLRVEQSTIAQPDGMVLARVLRQPNGCTRAANRVKPDVVDEFALRSA
jgi:hypothetical protein